MSQFSALNDLGYVNTESSGMGDRVVLGPFSDKQAADDALRQIKNRGFNSAFVVKYQDGLRVGR